MRRGEIRTVAGGAAYAGKPRPAVIIQDDRFDANDSVVVCPLTTDSTSAPIFRLPIPSNARTGLRAPCRLMVDKLNRRATEATADAHRRTELGRTKGAQPCRLRVPGSGRGRGAPTLADVTATVAVRRGAAAKR